MAYQVLARKSRPQDFSSVVGQSSVVTALRNALSEERVAQAYLFAGIRGVGKTSVARVFAKALNCENGPGADPCNECTTCTEITKGSDLDVIEVDAATYSKVEQVRELTESLQYGPARDRYKVVVIDEIHRLSRQAFDALLKIVEEPPERIVFIFATTEIDAVPATILSRCQEFHFRRVAFGELSAHLRRLCDSESITASDASLRLISRAAEGSVRDAVALLDQLATFGAGTIDDADAARLIGGLDADFYQGLLVAIVEGDGGTVCRGVAKLEEEGWDPRTAYTQLLSYLRDALHMALGASADEVDLPEEQAKALGQVAHEAGSENLLRILHLLLGSEMTVRRSESGALAAEVAWLRAAELPKLTRIEDLLSGIEPSGGGGTRGVGGPGAGRGGSSKAGARAEAKSAVQKSAPQVEAEKKSTAVAEIGEGISGPKAAALAAAQAVAEASQTAPTAAAVKTAPPEPKKPEPKKPEPRKPEPSAVTERSDSPAEAPTKSEQTAPPNRATAEPEPQSAAAVGEPAPAPAPQRAGQKQAAPKEAVAQEPPIQKAGPSETANDSPPLEAYEDEAYSSPPGRSNEIIMPREAVAAPVEAPNQAPAQASTDEPAERAAQSRSKPAPNNGAAAGETARLLEEVGRRKQFLAAHLAEAKSLRLQGGRLEIAVPADDTWLANSLEREANRDALKESIAAVWGDGVTWTLVSTGEDSVQSQKSNTPLDTQDDIMTDPEVQTVLELFGGTVETTASNQEDEQA